VDRRALAQAIAALQPGDTLLVTRLDRLARSTLQLLTVLDRLNQTGALFRSLSDTWADTTTPHGRLMLAVLGGLAEFERELIKSRTSEGRRRATARGIKMGPKFKLSHDQRRFVAEERTKGGSVRQLARVLGVSKATIGRIPPCEID
jgi:DNA invertase Pin-like site-specific DNA recombinase